MNDDVISRQEALDALADMHCKSDEDGYVWIIRSDAWARIDALPPAQPEHKKGKWVDDTYCSECGWANETDPGFIGSVDGFNFCPRCGIDMREDE